MPCWAAKNDVIAAVIVSKTSPFRQETQSEIETFYPTENFSQTINVKKVKACSYKHIAQYRVRGLTNYYGEYILNFPSFIVILMFY